jgi:hypothetical protein
MKNPIFLEFYSHQKFMVASLVGDVGLHAPAGAGAAFYADALGGMRRDGAAASVNVGDSQIRLLDPPDTSESDELQPWAGHLELWTLEPLEQLVVRLQQWDSPPIRILLDHSADPDARVLCTCPWGNKLVIRPAHQAHEVKGEPPGGCGPLVAISRVVCAVPTGTSRAIHAFWISILGCAADHQVLRGGVISFCIAHMGSGQQIVFEERADEEEGEEGAPAPQQLTDDAHAHAPLDQAVVVYVQSREAFRTAYMAAASKQLLDGAQPWEGVEAASEFRVHPTIHGLAARLGVVLCLRSITHAECPKRIGRRVGSGRMPGGFGARARELATSAAPPHRPASPSAAAGAAPASGRAGSVRSASGRAAGAGARVASPKPAASRASPAPSRVRKRSPSLGGDPPARGPRAAS